MIKFIIPIIPKAQARTRAGVNQHTGRAQVFTSRAQRQNQNDLVALMAPYAPERPMDGPLDLSVKVVLPVPNSWSQRKRADALDLAIRPTGRPDLDNYLKQVMDCMTKLQFWSDDSQVASIVASKIYGEHPRWIVRLETA